MFVAALVRGDDRDGEEEAASGSSAVSAGRCCSRIVARPGSKAYGRLALLAQWRCEAQIVMHLPPSAFSAKQLKAKAAKRKCKGCVGKPVPESS